MKGGLAEITCCSGYLICAGCGQSRLSDLDILRRRGRGQLVTRASDLVKLAVLDPRDAQGADLKPAFSVYSLEDLDLIGEALGLT